MERYNKLVNFEMCKTCEHFEKEPYNGPCHECLQTPARQDSHRPVYWKAKENSQK